ncbi:MAG: hypothetical protein HOP10_10630 [Chitinophagaceae bacterium]|nr:hypothetical protein [Chitinophagaceae bacterium]
MDQFQNTNPNPTSSLFQMNLDAQNSYNLRSSASWAKVLGVVGILTGAILIIMMGITLSRIEEVDRYSRYDRNTIQEIFAAKTGLWIMIISGIIFIIGGVFSFNFGNRINAALKSNDQDGLNAGFAALRNYFALRGITLIIVLILFLIGLANMV